jgi:thioredoxin
MATKQQFSSFSDLLANAATPVLVDFYAPWCGPCQMMAGILHEVNGQMHQQVKVVKINVDNYPAIASQYQVSALPTLVLFKQGQPTQRIEGVVPAAQLLQQLKAWL